VSADVDKRRIYIDIEEDTVYSVNTQYAGNTVGFKKLSLRLAIRKADREGWLAEHMFVMGAHGPQNRVTYFVGAFPSACGKTSTAMIPGETIIGDDLAYLRNIDGQCRAVNVESGIFGIIRNVNSEDDPELWQLLTTEGEVIFSNVLDAGGVPRWVGDNRDEPEEGVNHAGEWTKGMKDANGNAVSMSHFNARYTIRLAGLRNLDPKANAPEGVDVGGIIYGGRDADTNVPCRQALDWTHGVCALGASLESETTAATLGKSGVRSFQPMSNKDFISLDLGKYIQNHLDFGAALSKAPAIFAVNYFQKDADGSYLTGMKHKYVWLKWMERRANGELEAIATPTGLIPVYDDLVKLFKDVLDLDYAKEDYVKQFTVHIPQNLAQLDRVEKMYKEDVADTPQVFFDTLAAQRTRLEEAKAKHGEHISPEAFA
jgi:phosphoenolpyruvate carboxykinase (GTP)